MSTMTTVVMMMLDVINIVAITHNDAITASLFAG